MSYEDNISFLMYMAARTRNFKKQTRIPNSLLF